MLRNGSSFSQDPAESTDRIAQREVENLQQYALAPPQTQTPGAQFVFSRTGGGRGEQMQGTAGYAVEEPERRGASRQVDASDASEMSNPLHMHVADT